MKSFFVAIKRTKLRYSTIILSFLIVSAVVAVGRILMNLLSGEMNEAASVGDVDALVRFITLITGVLVVRAAAAAVSIVILARFSARAAFKLRELFVNHFLRAPFSTLEKTASGEHLSIYSNDIPLAENLIASGILGLIADFLIFVSAFIFLIIISPQFTGVLFLAAVGMLVLQFLLSVPLQKLSVKMSEAQAKFNAVVNDSLQNLSVVAAYSLDEVLEDRYMDAYNKYFKILKRAAVALALTLGTMLALLFSPIIVIVTVLALATVDGNMSLAEFVAFSTTITMVASGLTMMGQNIAGLARSAAGAKRLIDNTSDPEEDLGADEKVKEVAISFSNVSFTYGRPNDENPPAYALDSASFNIAQGSKIAIIGGSGSGKSTILKLLLGLYEPTSGEISINGQNATELPKNHLRNIFSYVPQDSFLFPESIGKNITLEDTVSDMPRLEKACADAGILDFINTLPDRFDGILTEAADNISGGQRQRIAIARAFYKDAPVILFDEATSSLDRVTEAAVLDSFNQVASNKTVIIVAHRESAIAFCDTVITMDNGKIMSIDKKGA
ncbi:MAG: ABC transporter ATP-binding protein/permease [Firmicutes bacterium]|nr:ABC transporter ATP-binding protein/permease [Bacillota bacterium]